MQLPTVSQNSVQAIAEAVSELLDILETQNQLDPVDSTFERSNDLREA